MKVEAIADEKLAERDWIGYMCRCGRANYLDVFCDELLPIFIKERLYGDYWKSLAYVVNASEWIYPNLPTFVQLLEARFPNRNDFMDADDLAKYINLPPAMTIYRGYAKRENEFGADGISWTLDEDKARHFAKFRAYGKENASVLVTGECLKGNVIGYLNERQEDEIVIVPSNVKCKREKLL